MKNIVLVAAGGLAVACLYAYVNSSRVMKMKPAEQITEEKVSIEEVKPGANATEMMTPGNGNAVVKFDASPRVTMPTPKRLLINTTWPNSSFQEVVRY